MTSKRTVVIATASALVLALGTSGAVLAGDKGRGHWRHGPPRVPPGHVHVYHPAPVYYAAPVVVAPAPVYVAPAPVYAVPVAPVYAVPSRPVVTFGAVIPLR
ncbi:MAG: hypothetical protein AB7O88_09245 [Reyranellaceae bacterium]